MAMAAVEELLAVAAPFSVVAAPFSAVAALLAVDDGMKSKERDTIDERDMRKNQKWPEMASDAREAPKRRVTPVEEVTPMTEATLMKEGERLRGERQWPPVLPCPRHKPAILNAALFLADVGFHAMKKQRRYVES